MLGAIHRTESKLTAVSLGDELEQAASAAAAYGPVAAVLAAESVSGRRAYLVALGEDEERRWLVVDGALGLIDERERIREVASIVVLCELAAELAGGGQLEELRNQLAAVRMTEQPDGIEVAEDAALELERTIGVPPRLASPSYLDEVGAATHRLEAALGQLESPFANALAAESGTVDAFVTDVLANLAGPSSDRTGSTIGGPPPSSDHLG
jgi:hypothetical protein